MAYKTMLYWTLFVLLGSVVSNPVLAQNPENTDHPIACLHDAFAAFSFMTGEWEVASRYRNADGKWEETTAAATITPDMDGCLLTERFRGTRHNQPFIALAIMSYNQMTNQLQRAFVDSGHGVLVLFEGEATSDSLALQHTMRIRDQDVLFEYRYTNIRDDSFTMESRRSVDGGATWNTGWYLTYRRTS